MLQSEHLSLWAAAALAQNGASSQPPVPGAVGAGSSPAVQGAPAATGTGGGGGAGGMQMFWILMLGMLLVIVLTSMSGRKQEKQRKAMLSALKRNDRVQTVGGIIGTIVDLTDNELVLRVDEVSNTRIRFSRSAVQQVLRESKEPAKTDVEAKPRSEAASVK